MTELTVEEHLAVPAPDADAPEPETAQVVQHWIAGEATSASSTRTADVFDPATGEVARQVLLAEPGDDRVVVLDSHQRALCSVRAVLADDQLAAAREERRKVGIRRVDQRRRLLHPRREVVRAVGAHVEVRVAGDGVADPVAAVQPLRRVGGGVRRYGRRSGCARWRTWRTSMAW